MCFVTCYGCFCRVCVATYPCLHQACSPLPLEPCNRCCGGGQSGSGGCHCGGRPSGSGGCHGGSGPGFVRGGSGLDDEPCPTLPRGVCACTCALAVGRSLCTGSVDCSVTSIVTDVGRAFACAGAYLGAGGLAFPGGWLGSDDLTCKDRTNIAMSLCAVAGVRCCCDVDVWSTFLCPSLDEISAHNVGVCVTYPCYI